MLTTTYKIGKGVDLQALTQTIKRAQPGLLIVAAGDGTVSRVLGHLVGSSIEVGVVPLGTTNNFARSLSIPLSIDGAVAVIARSKSQDIDMGQVGERHFANVVGVGMSAHVASRVNDTLKRRWGRFAYALVGLRSLVSHQPFVVSVTDKDGELELHFETHQVIVANGRHHAGQAIADDAGLNSHELIVFAIGGKSRLSFLMQTIKFYVGSRKSARQAPYLIARDITIRTTTPQSSEVDGEVYQSTPLRFRVASNVIRVRCEAGL